MEHQDRSPVNFYNIFQVHATRASNSEDNSGRKTQSNSDKISRTWETVSHCQSSNQASDKRKVV